jgi:colanic acid/amylovoran biosynthesis glycosyltransferase
MINVAHVMPTYLGQPETFIWQYLHRFKKTYPVVITRSVQNLDQFPLARGKIVPVSGKRLSRPWFLDNWYRRVLKRPLGYVEKIIRKEGAHLIHAHYGPVGCELLPILSSIKVPLITNFYGYDLSVDRVLDNNKKEYQELFKKGTYFLVEGPCMRERLVSLGCPEEKILLQRIALDLDNYDFKPSKKKQANLTRFLFVGRFVEKKGLEYALRALAKLKGDFQFEVRIIGDGKIEERMHQLELELGFTKQINWLGVQTHHKVIQELHACDILIQPSVTASDGDSEGGAPTIILEAQACGVPVISTTHADIPYITCSEKSALLSPERDVENLYNNILYLLKNPEIWPEIGKNGRKHVQNHHDVKKEVSTLERIYENCTG